MMRKTMSKPYVHEYEPVVVAGEAVADGVNLVVRVAEGEYVGVPSYLLPPTRFREGDRVRVEVRFAVSRTWQEEEDDAAPDTAGVAEGADGGASEAEPQADAG